MISQSSGDGMKTLGTDLLTATRTPTPTPRPPSEPLSLRQSVYSQERISQSKTELDNQVSVMHYIR